MADTNTQIQIKREPAVPAMNLDWPASFTTLRQNINRLFDDFGWPDFRSMISVPVPTVALTTTFPVAPPMDLVERDGEYEVQAELPGLALDDVEVSVSEGMLNIKGEKSTAREEDKAGYHLQERSFGEFRRSFRLPASVEAGKIEASMKDGVLKIRLPKSAEAKQQERKIEVKAA